MYTDGLIESRHRPVYDGIDVLVTFLMGTQFALEPMRLIGSKIIELVTENPAQDHIAVVAVQNVSHRYFDGSSVDCRVAAGWARP